MPKTVRRKRIHRAVGRPIGTDNGTCLLIIRTASALLDETGLEGLSNRLICERSGITPPTLYHYFPDKNALLDALVTHAFTEFTEGKERKVSTDPLDRFKEGWRSFAKFAATKPEHFKLMASASIAGRMPTTGYEIFNSPSSDIEGIKKKYGLKVSVPLAVQLSMSTAFGIFMMPIGAPNIPWEAGLSEAALEAVLQFILK